MDSERDWGDSFKLLPSPGPMPRQNPRAPLSPLERNVSRTMQRKDTQKLRAVKSLDLEAFKTQYPLEPATTATTKLRSAPQMLRSCRSMALRPEAPFDALHEKVQPLATLSTLEDLSDLSFHSQEDVCFQVSDVSDTDISLDVAAPMPPSQSESEDTSEEYSEPEIIPSEPIPTVVDGIIPHSSHSGPVPIDPAHIAKEPPPNRISLPNSLISPPILSPTLGHSPTKRDSFDSDVSRPQSSSRHRRALSRIAAIGEVPPMMKTPDRTPLNSPKVDQMCIFTAADAARTSAVLEPAQGLDSLQNIFSILAQKERRVLEAEHALRDARTDLVRFRERLNAMMDPSQAPLATICAMPNILSRKHQPNLGIHGLHYVQAAPQPTSSVTEPPSIDEDVRIRRESIAFRLVHSLLDLVHCIISVFPTHTHRVITPQELIWYPEYPSPSRFLYGMEL